MQLRKLISESLRLSDLAREQLAFFHGKCEYWACTSSVLQKDLSNCLLSLPNFTSNEIAPSSHFLQQQSKAWFELKKSYPVSGSSLYEINGFGTLKQKQQRYNEYHKGIIRPPASSDIQQALDHGTANEVNAIATICTNILPALFPNLLFFEIGSVTQTI